MVEFRMMGYNPMDREYHEAISEAPKEEVNLEKPIFPISELGQTVPEHDPAGRFKNIIQTTQAAIRGGAGTLQIVLMTPHESAIGGRPKAYGKEVREALREVALASGVNIAGVELPTSLNNLSGFDYQQFAFSEEKRKQSLEEVKDAIKFTADIARGGGVDIVSWEFPRSINDAPFQEKEKGRFEQVGEQPIKMIVDDRTGRTMQIRKTEVQHLPYDPETFKEITEVKDGKPVVNAFAWEDFVRWGEKEGKRPEQIYMEKVFEGQIKTLEGWRSTYMGYAEEVKEKALKPAQEEYEQATGAEKEAALKKVKQAELLYREKLQAAIGQEQQAKEVEERKKHLKPLDEYAFAKSTDSYAKAGIIAMQETHEGMEKGRVTKPIHVGPEIGWPGFFGSHPDEFIKLVKKSRDRMADLLSSRQVKDSETGEMVDNPYFRQDLNKSHAMEEAKKHIKGLFDTSHMGMWLAHFKPEKDPQTGTIETEDKRVQRFNKWYKEQVEKIAKEDVVGSIQLVDSMSAAHGHLPPGQGIFPVKEAAEIFKKNKFSGFIVSEGHEEEKFGEGRILTKTWQAMGSQAPIGRGYFASEPVGWGRVQSGYFGKTYSPTFMFGSYAPSNEFKLWSEIPLE
ncbi:MAG TPA: TIM barrel protein [Candidatus Nanoarchaeia archaeon]|nr:TIM barrel protein [Candidatus Nanoarchaeia archaeon]